MNAAGQVYPIRRVRKRTTLQVRVAVDKNPCRQRHIDLTIDALLYPERGFWRPRTRADCKSVPRPCPYVGCRHHLYLDVSAGGGLTFNFADLEPWELEHSCSLDVVEARGELTIYELAKLMRWGHRWASKQTVRAVRKVKHLAVTRPVGWKAYRCYLNLAMDGRTVQQWSRHYPWNPAEDTLATHMVRVEAWLGREFTKR